MPTHLPFPVGGPGLPIRTLRLCTIVYPSSVYPSSFLLLLHTRTRTRVCV